MKRGIRITKLFIQSTVEYPYYLKGFYKTYLKCTKYKKIYYKLKEILDSSVPLNFQHIGRCFGNNTRKKNFFFPLLVFINVSAVIITSERIPMNR